MVEVGKQSVTFLPGLTGPAERIEGRATPWRGPCCVGVQAEADLGCQKRAVTPPAAAAVPKQSKKTQMLWT